MIRTLALTIALAAPLAASAQTTYVMPNGAGGYTALNPNGTTTFIHPNGAGGYVIIGPTGVPAYNSSDTINQYLNFSNTITRQWDPQRLYPQR